MIVVERMANLNNKQMMPDVATHIQAPVHGQLNRVGMSEVELPIRIHQHLIPAKGDFYVSLDRSDAKGIHMSRLYLHAEKILEQNEFGFVTLEKILDAFLESHQGLSQEAYAELRFETMLRRPALLSSNQGWRFYPTRLSGYKNSERVVFELNVKVAYSSTCPCSAALARQLIQQKFLEDFGRTEGLDFEKVVQWLGSEQGIVATPHSQRSIADITLRFDQADHGASVESVINAIEQSLQTAVQAAVKREDEQEFARLNGQNTMFCEDAARRLKETVEVLKFVKDFRVEARHVESLHPHDAVAIAVKGIPGGLVS